MRTRTSKQIIDSNCISDCDVALSHLTETDKAYFAGIIDGEGCVTGFITKKRRFHCRVTITNTDMRLLNWVKEKVPFFYIHKLSLYSPKHKQGYVAVIGKRHEIYAFLRAISPYMVIKKERANKLVDLIRDRIVSGRLLSDEVVSRALEFRAYNKRGPQ